MSTEIESKEVRLRRFFEAERDYYYPGIKTKFLPEDWERVFQGFKKMIEEIEEEEPLELPF